MCATLSGVGGTFGVLMGDWECGIGGKVIGNCGVGGRGLGLSSGSGFRNIGFRTAVRASKDTPPVGGTAEVPPASVEDVPPGVSENGSQVSLLGSELCLEVMVVAAWPACELEVWSES